jgi:hypothetical protein
VALGAGRGLEQVDGRLGHARRRYSAREPVHTAVTRSTPDRYRDDIRPSEAYDSSMAGIGVIVILLVVLIPAAYLAWRFTRGGEFVAGGSFGDQMLGAGKKKRFRGKRR